MFEGASVCVVVPAFNEETQIEGVIAGMPELVDRIVVIDDASPDRTSEVVRRCAETDARVELIVHPVNQGVGGAIASGYEFARDEGYDVAVVMAGDGQMDPADLPAVVGPVARGEVEYCKGNRLVTGEAYEKIPKVRYFGNAMLSLLTKIASGYWHIADSQTGYTAISKLALERIDWSRMYKRYGQPNDLLVRLNVEGFKVRDVPIEPVYDVGEASGIKVHRVIFTIGGLLVRLFLWRLFQKYVIRDFHPLVFFYFFGFVLGLISILLFGRVFAVWFIDGAIPRVNALAAMFSFVSSSQFVLFAMWFDSEYNKALK